MLLLANKLSSGYSELQATFGEHVMILQIIMQYSGFLLHIKV